MATANAWKQIVEWHDAQAGESGLCGGVPIAFATPCGLHAVFANCPGRKRGDTITVALRGNDEWRGSNAASRVARTNLRRPVFRLCRARRDFYDAGRESVLPAIRVFADLAGVGPVVARRQLMRGRYVRRAVRVKQRCKSSRVDQERERSIVHKRVEVRRSRGELLLTYCAAKLRASGALRTFVRVRSSPRILTARDGF